MQSSPAGICYYKRVLLKLSGEVLQSADKKFSLDSRTITETAERLKTVLELGTQIAIVVGGGNIFRGGRDEGLKVDRNTGDYMGMLATTINALALQDGLEKSGVPTRVMTAIEMKKIAEPFPRQDALSHLEKGRVVIFAAGTGNPYFTTDSAAALRANEIGAEVLLKATKVDGIYSDDPFKNPDARRYAKLTFRQALQDNLKVMDAAAFALCMENNLPIIVFDFFKKGNILRILKGESVGTIVHNN